jgi:UTP-glucose-1-phosphate uridylyltransferase
VSARRAIVPAAGLGTRLHPLTLGTAKELLPLGRHPALVATLLEAAHAGVQKLCFVSSPRKEGLGRFLDGFELLRDFDWQLIMQPTPAGVLDAVERGLASWPEARDEAVAVLFPDLVHLPDQTALARLYAAHEACGAAVFGLRLATGADQLGATAAVRLEQPLGPADLEAARASGRPLRIREVGPKLGVPDELCTTFAQIQSPAMTRAIEARCRTGSTSGAPLDDSQLVPALNELSAGGALYGVLLPGEIIDLGNMPGYLDAARRFLSGTARLRGLS